MKMHKVAIIHNILWSSYKGEVFSEIWKLVNTDPSLKESLHLQFVQIASSEHARIGLSPVDLQHHKYPFELLHDGAYEDLSPLIAIKLIQLIRKRRFSIVVLPGYSRPEHWLLLAYLKMARIQTYVFCDATAFDRPQKRLRSLLKSIFFQLCQRVFCYGSRAREYVIGFGIKPENAITRCQAAALPPKYNRQRVLADIEQRDWNSQSEICLLYVGRLAKEKNVTVILQAMAAIRKKHLIEHVRLRASIIGAGPESDNLIIEAQELGIDDDVEFHGPMTMEGLATHYATAYCLILPSISEPWGLVVNESFSYGCPALVSNVCGCAPDLVIAGETGFTFDPTSLDDLVRTICKIATLRSERKKMGESALDLIQFFSPEKAARQILNALCARAPTS